MHRHVDVLQDDAPQFYWAADPYFQPVEALDKVCIYVACFGQHRNLKDFINVNFVIVSSSKTRTALNVRVETLIITDHVQSLVCCDCIGAVVLNILGF